MWSKAVPGAVAVIVATIVALGSTPATADPGSAFEVVEVHAVSTRFVAHDTSAGETYLIGSSQVDVVQTDGYLPLRTITLDFDPRAAALDSRRHLLYLGDWGGYLRVYDLVTGAWRTPIPLQIAAGTIIIDETRDRVYVGSADRTYNDARVVLVDNGSGDVITRYLDEASGSLRSLAFDARTDTLYAAVQTSYTGRIVALSATSGDTILRNGLPLVAELPFTPGQLVVNALDDSLLMVNSNGTPGLAVYDPRTLTPRGSIAVPAGQPSMGFDPTTGIAYIPAPYWQTGPVVVVVDSLRRTVITTIETPAAFGMTLDPGTGRMHLVQQSSVTEISGLDLGSLPAATSVYRFWSETFHAHFFTADASERDHIVDSYPDQVWKYEGVAYRAFLEPVPGTVPLFRFWSDSYQGHFFTTDVRERDFIDATYADRIWRDEGVAYYVFPESTTIGGVLDVARFWSPANRHHFFTADPAEAEYVRTHYAPGEWTYEGLTYSVIPTT